MSNGWTIALAKTDTALREALKKTGLDNPVLFGGAFDLVFTQDAVVDEAAVRAQLADFLLSMELAEDGALTTTARLGALDELRRPSGRGRKQGRNSRQNRAPGGPRA